MSAQARLYGGNGCFFRVKRAPGPIFMDNQHVKKQTKTNIYRKEDVLNVGVLLHIFRCIAANHKKPALQSAAGIETIPVFFFCLVMELVCTTMS